MLAMGPGDWMVAVPVTVTVGFGTGHDAEGVKRNGGPLVRTAYNGQWDWSTKWYHAHATDISSLNLADAKIPRLRPAIVFWFPFFLFL